MIFLSGINGRDSKELFVLRRALTCIKCNASFSKNSILFQNLLETEYNTNRNDHGNTVSPIILSGRFHQHRTCFLHEATVVSGDLI